MGQANGDRLRMKLLALKDGAWDLTANKIPWVLRSKTQKAGNGRDAVSRPRKG
jgi:hypothetical protein